MSSSTGSSFWLVTAMVAVDSLKTVSVNWPVSDASLRPVYPRPEGG
jgi:hypothetical protein